MMSAISKEKRLIEKLFFWARKGHLKISKFVKMSNKITNSNLDPFYSIPIFEWVNFTCSHEIWGF